MKNIIKTTALAAMLGAGAFFATSGAASAYVVCNGEGECWHTHDQYTYPNGFGVTVHDDSWRWGDADHYRWHEHDGRGYWHNGLWVTF
jgi:hypothetical protein